jgi:ketosteroid isomerase-like protein
MTKALEVVEQFFADPSPETMERVIAHDAVYVSLNYENAELKKIMPWTGTSHGRQAFVVNFANIYSQWTADEFTIEDLFGDEERVAGFGRFTYTSNTLGKSVTTPFAFLARVRDGQIAYFQFLEDTFATARSFHVEGTWKLHPHPERDQIEV